MNTNGSKPNNPDTNNGILPSSNGIPTGIEIKSRRQPSAKGRSASAPRNIARPNNGPASNVPIPSVKDDAANASPNASQPEADGLASKPTHATNETLRWWPSRFPVSGEMGRELKTHQDRLPDLLKSHPLRAWHATLRFLQGRSSTTTAEATERAAQSEINARRRTNDERRAQMTKALTELFQDATQTEKSLLQARKNLAAKAGRARLLLSDTDRLKLPGAVPALEAALTRRIPSDDVLAGGRHWLPGDATRHEAGDKHKSSAITFAVMLSKAISNGGWGLFNVLTALVCGALSGLTLGTVTGIIRPSDLRAPEYSWPSLVIAWVIGTFIEANAAHASQQTALIFAHGWNARPIPSGMNTDTKTDTKADANPKADANTKADALPATGGAGGDAICLVVTLWLFCGLTLAHGMGLHHIAESAAHRPHGASTAPNFPVWLFFAAGGVTTAAFMGSHAQHAWRKARANQRRAALGFLRWQRREELLKEDHVIPALEAAHQLDALAQHAIFLHDRCENLQSQCDETFATPLSEPTRAALRAADDEARGERTRAEAAIESLLDVLEPLPDAKSAHARRQPVGDAK